MTNYTIGRSFEYTVINHLRSKGYYCIRAYGSKGAIDILAIPKQDNPVTTLLEKIMPLSIEKDLVSIANYFKNAIGIQAKTNGYVPPKERERLGKIHEIPVYIAKRDNRHIIFKRFKLEKS